MCHKPINLGSNLVNPFVVNISEPGWTACTDCNFRVSICVIAELEMLLTNTGTESRDLDKVKVLVCEHK